MILVDEPTSNLDPASGAEVMAALRWLDRDQGIAVVVIIHDPAVASATDRIVRLHGCSM